MKGSVTRGLLTKDVRSADGWQIGMDVFDQYVQVRWSVSFLHVVMSHVMSSMSSPCQHHHNDDDDRWIVSLEGACERKMK